MKRILMPRSMGALLMGAALVVAACGGSESETVATPSPDREAAGPDDEASAPPAVGGIFDLPQSFGVRNDLKEPVTIAVRNVDPFDWVTGSGVGSPSDKPSKGFEGVTLKPGESAIATFMPNANATGAPFKLLFSDGGGNQLTSIEFDRVAQCFSTATMSPMVCGNPVLVTKSWWGWGYRGRVGNSLNQQYPAICGSTSSAFTASDGSRAHGRLECATLVMGPAIVLEEVS